MTTDTSPEAVEKLCASLDRLAKQQAEWDGSSLSMSGRLLTDEDSFYGVASLTLRALSAQLAAVTRERDGAILERDEAITCFARYLNWRLDSMMKSTATSDTRHASRARKGE